MANTVFREHAASAGLLDGADHLHLMNGDAAAEQLRRAGVAGPVVVWTDVLHEGPTRLCDTPGAVRAARAEHLASMGFGQVDTLRQRLADADAALGDPSDGRERVLWFEHDLYDQLLLLRHLHWLDAFGPEHASRASLICIGAFPGIRRFIGLGQLEPDQIVSLLDTRQPIEPQHLQPGGRGLAQLLRPRPAELSPMARRRHVLPALSATRSPAAPAAVPLGLQRPEPHRTHGARVAAGAGRGRRHRG